MHSKRLSMGPVEVVVGLNDDMFTISLGGAVRNRLWQRFYRRVLQPRLSGVPEQNPSRSGEAHIAIPIAAPSPEQQRILHRIAGVDWYHTIDLGHGVVTAGTFDLRQTLHEYPLPARLDGLRVLDVATYDGFWAFEAERRGASEVVALDVEKLGDIDLSPAMRAAMSNDELARPASRGFSVAHELLGSRVRREFVSIYDLTPERLGHFDIVFCGDLLIHLSNPVKALQRLRSVVRGFAVLCETFRPDLDRYAPYRIVDYEGGEVFSMWWTFSLTALTQMIADAGFSQVDVHTFRFGPRGGAQNMWHAAFRAVP